CSEEDGAGRRLLQGGRVHQSLWASDWASHPPPPGQAAAGGSLRGLHRCRVGLDGQAGCRFLSSCGRAGLRAKTPPSARPSAATDQFGVSSAEVGTGGYVSWSVGAISASQIAKQASDTVSTLSTASSSGTTGGTSLSSGCACGSSFFSCFGGFGAFSGTIG